PLVHLACSAVHSGSAGKQRIDAPAKSETLTDLLCSYSSVSIRVCTYAMQAGGRPDDAPVANRPVQVVLPPDMKRIVSIAGIVAVVGLLALPKILNSQKTVSAAQGPSQDTLAVDAFVVDVGMLEDRIYTTGSVRANESVDLV